MTHQLQTCFFEKKIFFLDGDGNIYLGDQVLPGSIEFIRLLQEHGKTFFLCTNNSSKTPSEYEKKYQSLGLSISKEHILISTHPAMLYLQKNEIRRLHCLATPKVESFLIESGFEIDTVHPEACLMTYDTTLTYDKLVSFCQSLRRGIPYFATHPDYVCPSDQGDLPDVGLFNDLIFGTVGRRPELVFGKPNIQMIMPILESLSLTLDDAVMVGDRLYTDMLLGEGNALTTVLNLSGETTEDHLSKSDIKPDLIIQSLQDWVSVL